MRKKIIILLIAILLVLGGLYFVKRPAAPGTEEGGGVLESLRNIFPSGDSVNLSGPDLGSGSADTLTGSQAPTDGTFSVPERESTLLWKVTSQPVTGLALVKFGSTSTIVYIDRSNGNIYRLNSSAPERLSNTTIPYVSGAAWGKDKYGVRLALEKTDKTGGSYHTGIFRTSTSSPLGEVVSSPLGGSIYRLTVSPAGDRLFVLNESNNKMTAVVTDWSSKPLFGVFSSTLKGWNIEWPEEGTLTLETSGASDYPGYLYFYTTKTKRAEKILGPINGLSSRTSPNAKYVLYSSAGGSLRLLDLGSRKETAVAVATIAEKCVWTQDSKSAYCAAPSSASASMPEGWYSGEINTVDSFWEIEASTGQARRILTPQEIKAEYAFDATTLTLDPKESLLYFVNRLDSSLWAISLKNVFPGQ